MGQFPRFTHRWVRYNLGSVLVEHDGVEVAALVVLDEVVRGVAGLHAAVPHVLVLLQRLVQREDDLAVGETVEGQTLLLHALHRADLLLLVLGELGEVEVEHGEAPGGDVAGGQTIHHEHGPHRPLALPVAGDGAVEVVSIQTAPSLNISIFSSCSFELNCKIRLKE